MHWTDKRAGRAALAHELMARGWKLFGYHADKSDSMTDYYSPADWYGVAVKGDALIVVDASAGDSGSAVLENKRADNGPCASCEGSGAAPGPWTLEKARAFPIEYHRWAIEQEHGRGSGVVALLAHVVSPISFMADGRRRCFKCHGTGRDVSYSMTEVGRWPAFQANPARCNWHVERGGKVLDKGIGVYGCEKEGKAKALADRMEAAGVLRGKAAAPAPVDTAPAVPVPGAALEVRPSSHRPDFVEVVFASKPGDDVRGALKAAGFRWAKATACWYGPLAALPSEAISAARPVQG